MAADPATAAAAAPGQCEAARPAARSGSPDHEFNLRAVGRVGARCATLSVARKLARRCHHRLRVVGELGAEDDVGKASFQGAHGVAVALAVGSSLLDEGLAWSDAAVLRQGDGVDRFVEQPIAAAVDPMPANFPGRGGNRGGAVGRGVGVVVAEPAYVPGLAEDPTRGDRTHAEQLH